MIETYRIAQLGAPEEDTPPPGYGGTERVVSGLTEALVNNLNQDVTLYATGNSTTAAKLVPITERATRTMPEAQDFTSRKILNSEAMCDGIIDIYKNGRYDIIHSHFYPDWEALRMSRVARELTGDHTPFVVTFHGPLTAMAPQMIYRQRYADEPVVSISNSQREPLPDLNYIETVYNGVQIDKLPFSDSPEDVWGFLGRSDPKKGLVEAIHIAKAAGKQLLIAAKIDPVNQPWHDANVAPLIDNDQIVWIGEIGEEATDDKPSKGEFLGRLAVLLNPIRWEEPFGLSPIEAGAAGTPVVTTPLGALPETVKDGVNGLWAHASQNGNGEWVIDIDDFAEKARRASNLSRLACREHVRCNFTDAAMAENYYYKVYMPLIRPNYATP